MIRDIPIPTPNLPCLEVEVKDLAGRYDPEKAWMDVFRATNGRTLFWARAEHSFGTLLHVGDVIPVEIDIENRRIYWGNPAQPYMSTLKGFFLWVPLDGEEYYCFDRMSKANHDYQYWVSTYTPKEHYERMMKNPPAAKTDDSKAASQPAVEETWTDRLLRDRIAALKAEAVVLDPNAVREQPKRPDPVTYEDRCGQAHRMQAAEKAATLAGREAEKKAYHANLNELMPPKH
jgi:hypothetical protein